MALPCRVGCSSSRVAAHALECRCFRQAFGLSAPAAARAGPLAGPPLRGARLRPARRWAAGGRAGRGDGLLGPLFAEPSRTRARASGGLDALLVRPEVGRSLMAAIGFRFGGTMALEPVRGGAALRAVVGFHGGPGTAAPRTDARAIRARVLVCIGGADPMITPDQRAGFEAEMRAAGWTGGCTCTATPCTASPSRKRGRATCRTRSATARMPTPAPGPRCGHRLTKGRPGPPRGLQRSRLQRSHWPAERRRRGPGDRPQASGPIFDGHRAEGSRGRRDRATASCMAATAGRGQVAWAWTQPLTAKRCPGSAPR